MYDRFQVDRLIDLWLAEDVGYGDLTAQLMLDEQAQATLHMNAREPMVIAGIEVAAMIGRRYDPTLSMQVGVRDGQAVDKGTRLMTISGSARSIVTVERTALNILQRLCGIATWTARFVAEIQGTKARLIDTRKTTPGLRMLEKHAVTCGGGLNHRLGLDNGVMLKDNHIAIAGSIAKMVVAPSRVV